MSAHYPGVRFSIRPDGARWLWRAVLDGALLAEGEAATRAVAAAHVIAIICRVRGAKSIAAVVPQAKAA